MLPASDPESFAFSGAESPIASGVEPLHSIENYLYYNLERFANVVVDVPLGSIAAEIATPPEPAKPSWLRHNSDFLFLAGAAATLVGFRLFGRAAVRATTTQARSFLAKKNVNSGDNNL